jgi:peroxiredoxin
MHRKQEILLLAFLLGALCSSQAAPAPLKLGSAAPNIALRDLDGNRVNLKDYLAGGKGKLLVVDFFSFRCPIHAAYVERLKAIHAKYQPKGVALVAVDPNWNEPAEELKKYAKAKEIRFPILIDRDAAAADIFGAQHTPTLYVFDSRGQLRYRGAVDNDRAVGQPGRKAYLEDALDAVLAGKDVPKPTSRAFGCSIKRAPAGKKDER